MTTRRRIKKAVVQWCKRFKEEEGKEGVGAKPWSKK